MIDILSIWKCIWKYRIQILILGFVFYAFSIGYYFYVKPRYISESKWISLSQDPSSSTLQKFGSLLGGGISSQDDFTNYKDIIISSEFLGPLLDQKILDSKSSDSLQLKAFLEKINFSKSKNDTLLNLAEKLNRKTALIGILKGWISFVSRSPIYQLRISTWDPVLSQTFNEKIIQRAISYNGNERLGVSKRKRKYLENQLFSFKSALNHSEDSLLVFETRNISSQSPKLLLERSRLMREVQINTKLVTEFRTEYELAKTDEDKDAVQISILENPSLPSDKSFPKKPLFFGGGLFGSFVISCVVFLLFGYFQELKKGMMKETSLLPK